MTAVLIDSRCVEVTAEIAPAPPIVVASVPALNVITTAVIAGPPGPGGGDSMWTDDGAGGAAIAGSVVIGGTLHVAGVRINPWVQLTAAEYAALPVKDPNTLYVVVG